MNPLFISSATGDRHREAALRLDQSFAAHDWPRLIVATESPLPGVRENVVAKNTLWGGRGLKAGFGQFIPENHTGPVVWVDADCEARGPLPGLPEMRSCEVHGLRWGPAYYGQNGWYVRLHSTVLVFPDAALARTVSADWIRYLRGQKGGHGSDQFALGWAIENLTKRALPGSHEFPLPNLWHDGRNSRRVNGRPPAASLQPHQECTCKKDANTNTDHAR